MLRWSLGSTKYDKDRNENVRKRVEVGKLKRNLREKLLSWLGRVVRREENYVGKRIRQFAIGKRKKGQPKRRWKDCIREDLEVSGLKEEDAISMSYGGRQSAPTTPLKVGLKLEEEEKEKD